MAIDNGPAVGRRLPHALDLRSAACGADLNPAPTGLIEGFEGCVGQEIITNHKVVFYTARGVVGGAWPGERMLCGKRHWLISLPTLAHAKSGFAAAASGRPR